MVERSAKPKRHDGSVRCLASGLFLKSRFGVAKTTWEGYVHSRLQPNVILLNNRMANQGNSNAIHPPLVTEVSYVVQEDVHYIYLNSLQRDLRSFHDLHFGNGAGPVEFFPSHDNYEDEDDDGLGFYPDGTKRTLTDDQIAMFRHSEVQVALRERRLAQDTSDHEARHAPVAPTRSETSDVAPRKQFSRSPETTSDQTKRKWEHFVDVSAKNPEHLTHRRMARELDEIRPDSVDLAYGEEELQPPVLKKRAKREPLPFQWPEIGPTVISSGGG